MLLKDLRERVHVQENYKCPQIEMSVEQHINCLIRIYNRNLLAYEFYLKMMEEAKENMIGYPFYRIMKNEKEKAEIRLNRVLERYSQLLETNGTD
jgi:hypothetical protein